MKVNEWFQLLELQTVSRDDVCAVCMYRLLNIILTTVGSDPEKVKGIRITKDNVYDELRSIDHNASIIWRLLGLQEDNDYFRYYALDMLTNGYYIKPLIGHIYYMLLHGVTLFHYGLQLDQFVSSDANAVISLQYRQFEEHGAIYLTSIDYKNPIRGDMELEEAFSILCDTLYILSPSCPRFLTELLLYGTPHIRRTANNFINVTSSISLFNEDTSSSMHTKYSVGVQGFPVYGIPIIEKGLNNSYSYKQYTLSLENIKQGLEVS